ncbi:MAG: DUF4402 domain-containing protein [Bacteroidota bacterium]
MRFSKLFVSAIAACALSTGLNAVAQTSVTSSATVTTPIVGTATAPLAFGTVTKGQANTVAETVGGAGAFNFSGDESDNVIVTVPASATLNTTSGDGSATLSVTLDRANMIANSTDNVQANATQSDASSGTVTVALSADADGNGTGSDGLGQAYLWIGGSVTPDATQQRGVYSGSFSVSAAYSN